MDRNKQAFQKELESLINRYSIENESDTPDFILAQYVRACLTAFATASNARQRWYGWSLEPGQDPKRIRLPREEPEVSIPVKDGEAPRVPSTRRFLSHSSGPRPFLRRGATPRCIFSGEIPWDAVVNNNSLDIVEEQAFESFVGPEHASVLSLHELEDLFVKWSASQ